MNPLGLCRTLDRALGLATGDGALPDDEIEADDETWFDAIAAIEDLLVEIAPAGDEAAASAPLSGEASA